MSMFSPKQTSLLSFFLGQFFILILFCSALGANETLGEEEHLGGYVPLDIPFLDETGKQVTLGQLMDGKPAILTLNYYVCPALCTLQLQDLAKNLEKVKLTENKDYKVITLSFDPVETPKDAAHKKSELTAAMTQHFDTSAWAFFTGTEANINQITQSVGFHYEKQVGHHGMVEYIHPAVLIALSPEGKITRYLNGIKQLPFDIQMAMMEASQGTVRPTIAKTLLFCFAFDAKSKTYVWATEKIVASVLSLILGGFFLYLVLTGRKKNASEENDA